MRDGVGWGRMGGACVGGTGVFFYSLPRPPPCLREGTILASSTHHSRSVLLGLGRRGGRRGVGRERRPGRGRVGAGSHWLGMWTHCAGRLGGKGRGQGENQYEKETIDMGWDRRKEPLACSLLLLAGGLGVVLLLICL